METEQLFAYAFVALVFILVLFGLPLVYHVLRLTNQNLSPEVVESIFAKFLEAVIVVAREAASKTENTLDDALLDMVASKPVTGTVTTTTTTVSEPASVLDLVIKERIEPENVETAG